MAVEVYVADELVRHERGSVSFEDRVDDRQTARFTAVVEPGEAMLAGSLVELREDGELLWRGIVGTVSEERVGKTDKRRLRVDCIGPTYFAEKRLVARGFVDERAGDIVRAIIDDLLADEGVSEGEVEDGPEVREARFSYVSAFDALEELTEVAGFTWTIDRELRLHFHARDAFPAPSLSDEDVRDERVEVVQDPVLYRNRQYLQGGKLRTDEQVERFRGDGEQETFTVGFPLAEEPTITVDGQAQDVGIRGVEEGKDFYWNKGDTQVTQDRDLDPPADGAAIEVTYVGEFDAIIQAEDVSSQENLAERQPGSGIVEEVDDAGQLTGYDEIMQRAGRKLARHTGDGRELRFTTLKPGFEAGQVITPDDDMAPHGIAGSEWKIESVTADDQLGVLRYHVTAVEGPMRGSWARYFRLVERRAKAERQPDYIGAEEQLVILVPEEEDTELEETVEVDVFACPLFPLEFPAKLC